MRRGLAIFLTFPLLWTGSAQAQNAAAVVQQIHDGAYSQCMSKGQFGAGAELQENCSCSADVVVDLLSDDFKQAIAAGTQASFQGAKLAGDELQRNVLLLRTCPKIGTYLTQQCAGDSTNPHCQVLQRALQQAGQ
jgi:hypothetical protein